MIKLLAVWIFADAIYSLKTYWGKEDKFAQGIRWARLVCSLIIIIWR